MVSLPPSTVPRSYPSSAERFHIVAPDLPGFVNSDMPDGRNRSTGSPNDRSLHRDHRLRPLCGLRVRLRRSDRVPARVKHPDRITAIISQNGNAYEEGLSDGCYPIRAYWKDASPSNRAVAALLSEALKHLLSVHSLRNLHYEGFPVLPFSLLFLSLPAPRDRGAARPVRLLQEQRLALSYFPAVLPYPQAALAGGVWQERSILLAASRGGLQALHPERDVRFFYTVHFSL